MSGFDIEADESANRLHMELRGSLSEAEAASAIERVEAEAAKLSPGFDVINDISAFKPLSQDVADIIAEGKEALTVRDAAALVRVTGDSALGDMQFSRVGGDEGYEVTKAETVAEAEAKLDER
ncbi:hypothetical protein [Halorussus pelagicus]|uniref:hypothetical protein n=1 Tax=Halorussus pelagicus TaxID=2505977 RepID=UPI000FFBF60C|nr:hypothetical protein [Halorussus pelagicus]